VSPGFGKAHSLLAVLALQEGDFNTAKQEAALALRINPRDFQAALTLAKGVLFSKEYETAVNMFSELHDKVPTNVEVLGSLGLAHMAINQEDKAKEAFDKLLALQPGNQRAFTFLLQLEQKKGAANEQLIAMTRSQIDKAPDSGGLWILLGNLYLRANQPDQALETYKKAQELAPENPQPYAMSAMILNRQGKTEQAIAEYTELLAQQPRAIGAFMGLASIYDQQGETALAKDTYRKILELQPDFAPAANNLAWMIAESEDPDLGEALRLAMIARQQLPEDVHIIDTLGWVHYKRGAFSLARNEFEQAVQRQGDMPVLRYHLALAYYGEGRTEEAIRELKLALSQEQPFQERDEAEKILQKWLGE
jgi:tetratricopeptide (TPR) repeat protein